jgi:GNAT superfamily N-acetyltransferase
LIPATLIRSTLLRRTFVASTLCATKQLNKIPPSAEPFIWNIFIQLSQKRMIYVRFKIKRMNTDLQFRLATKDDLFAIIQMLFDDTLGASREALTEPLPASYAEAFAKISNDPNHELTVVELNGEKVATFHLTYLPYLTYQGGMRAQIESVRTHSKFRGQGIGTSVFQYAINRAKEKGCHMIQLTSDKKRPDAIRFYEALGFVASHEGMKMIIA